MSAQLSLNLARQQADRGIALAELGAENAHEGWSELAFTYLKLYARLMGGTFTAEQVLEAADKHGLLKPPNDRAWGQVFRTAARRGIIVKAGVGVCRKRHASVCVLWRAV